MSDMKKEYAWALAHPDVPAAAGLLKMATLYAAHPEHAALALAESYAADVRKEMLK